MTVKIILDTRYVQGERYPLKIYFRLKKKAVLLSTGFFIGLSQWSRDSEVINHPLAAEYNHALRMKRNAVENILLKEVLYPEADLLSEIKTLLTGKSKAIEEKAKPKEQKVRKESQEDVFLRIYARCTKVKEAQRTRELYDTTLKKILLFDPNVHFQKITSSWLEDFDVFLREQELSVNTRSIYLRNVRAVYNYAMNNGIIVVEMLKYPFRNFKIKKETTQKRNLSMEALIKIKNIELEDSYLCQYRDIFMLIFYMIGINLVDLISAKKTDIVNGRLEYRRTKTKRLYSIKIEPEAQKIIDRYSGEKYLLNIAERYQDYRNYTWRINKNLKLIYPGLTTYWARHSWASMAAELDVAKEIIAAALGHGKETTTDIYINFNKKKVDIANRQVIELLYGVNKTEIETL